MRKSRRATATVVLFSAFALSGCGTTPGFGGGQAAGQCAAPIVTVTPAAAAPGDTVTVTSDGLSVCEDTPNDPSGEAPCTEVRIEWAQGDTSRELRTADITDTAISAEVTVPDDATAGPARICVLHGDLAIDGDLTVTG